MPPFTASFSMWSSLWPTFLPSVPTVRHSHAHTHAHSHTHTHTHTHTHSLPPSVATCRGSTEVCVSEAGRVFKQQGVPAVWPPQPGFRLRLRPSLPDLFPRPQGLSQLLLHCHGNRPLPGDRPQLCWLAQPVQVVVTVAEARQEVS